MVVEGPEEMGALGAWGRGELECPSLASVKASEVRPRGISPWCAACFPCKAHGDWDIRQAPELPFSPTLFLPSRKACGLLLGLHC